MTKVNIICPIHGIFKQSPNNHTHKTNPKACPKCAGNIRLSKDEFIRRSKDIHGDKYLYDFVVYKNVTTKVKLYCNDCGSIVEQSPSNHLYNKHSCKFCTNHENLTNSEFIRRSKDIHGDKYNYDKTKYINAKTKVEIYCNTCNKYFLQYPFNHTDKGYGCRICGIRSVRTKTIERINKNLENGFQIFPNYNKYACGIFDSISKKESIHIQHAMNGGEYYIKELGYWLDGYDEENNIVYEYDETHHFDKYGNLNEKDKRRQDEITNYLKCKFIRLR